jgi:hypothetical protein
MCAFDLAERQAVDLKNVRRRVQELERVGLCAIAPSCHVYPKIVLCRTTGLRLLSKIDDAPPGPRNGRSGCVPRRMRTPAGPTPM